MDGVNSESYRSVFGLRHLNRKGGRFAARGGIFFGAFQKITENATLGETQIAYFQRLANLKLKNPVMVGFGISDHAPFETVCSYLNGGVVGSAFIRAQEAGVSPKAFVEKLTSMAGLEHG